MTPSDPDFRTRIEDSFARQSFAELLGISLDALEPGRCSLSAPITAQVAQQHGFAHAGLAFTLGDSAAGYSALSLMDKDREVLTVEMKINLMRPASGDRLVAEGSVIKPGRTLSVVEAKVYAVTGEARRLVAQLQGTMMAVDP